MKLPHIIVILGPTCSHKSFLGESLHSLIPGSVIVNFDAFQIYKEMDIGTAKPSKEELNKGYYYFYDYLSLKEDNNIYFYQEISRKFIESHKDNTLIFIGGSGLYIKACLFNYIFNKDEVKMPLDYKSNYSNEELFNELKSIDLEASKSIHVNNRKRLLRALFINEIEGKNKNDINKNKCNELLYKDSEFIFINPDRETLYNDINLRVDKMKELGLKEEAINLLTKYKDDNLLSLNAIGYKEFKYLLSNELNEDEVFELIKKNTRNYAKRQITFFKHQFPEYKEYDNVSNALNDLIIRYDLNK